MTIFIKLFKVFKAIGFAVMLFSVSYLFTSLVYYSRNHETEEIKKIEIIQDKNIEVIDQKVKEYIILDVKLKKQVNDEYLIAYTLSYKDIHNKEVHLNVVDKEIVINTGKTEILMLKK